MVSRRSRGPGDRQNSVASAIVDQHGTALLSLAVALIGARHAEEAVVEVICAAYPASLPDRLAPTEVRQELAQRLYLHCDSQASGRNSEQDLEQIALALAYCGQLDYRVVANLLEVQPETVVRMLNSTLRREASSAATRRAPR
ncbi:hypothetical protein [Kribbella sp. NPDC051718]|uniref:hypothetical protein n=1 Tax=Kribbella sp. NPDC051718 TaxID=3155168 RepID=UPI003418D0DB